MGRIINTASAHSSVASPFKAAYVAAKHGIVGLTKTAALELATFGVTVNCISPGYVWTPLVERQIPETMKARDLTREQVIETVLLEAQPTRQFVTVEQVAAFAVFLCSDAAAQITGANLAMDGGWDRPMNRKKVTLALQGGGAHGAFTWGVLDAFLADGRLDVKGISGASAGAMNAVVLADGLREGGAERARLQLAEFWRAVSVDGAMSDQQRSLFDALLGFWDPLELRNMVAQNAATYLSPTSSIRSTSTRFATC